jgi:hypothetical protein
MNIFAIQVGGMMSSGLGENAANGLDGSMNILRLVSARSRPWFG